MVSSHGILIVQRAADLPPKLRDALKAKGYVNRVVTDYNDLDKHLERLASPILVVYCGEDRDELLKSTKTLLATNLLHPFPLLLIGAGAPEVQEAIVASFPIAHTIAAPCALSELISGIAQVAELFDSPKANLPGARANIDASSRHGRNATERADETKVIPASALELTAPSIKPAASTQTPSAAKAMPASASAADLSAASSKPATPTQEPTAIVELPTELPDAELANAVAQARGSIHQALFSQLEDLGVLKCVIGGKEYARSTPLPPESERSYLPLDIATAKLVEQVCEQAGPWGGPHLHRVAFLSYKVLGALQVSTELREHAKLAAFFYALSFAGDRQELLRRDYLSHRSIAFKRELCSKIKDSAMRVAVDYEFPQVGKILGQLARLIGEEEAVEDQTMGLIASTIMAVDLTDRACCKGGVFDPRLAHSFLVKLRAGHAKNLHPLVIGCILKVIAEALSFSGERLLVPKRIRKKADYQERIQAYTQIEVRPGEEKIRIENLAPGMRLTRPLLAIDGRQVLKEDLLLDQDLIFRIWQLSAIRPLFEPFVLADEV